MPCSIYAGDRRRDYTPCLQKTVPTYFLLLVCQIWTDFNKNWKECTSRNKPLTKLCLKCPLHLKHVLALPWETWSARLTRKHNNEVHIWMINWITSNITGSYCLLSLKKSHMSHHIVFITGCAQNVRLQHERKCIDTGATSQEHIQ